MGIASLPALSFEAPAPVGQRFAPEGVRYRLFGDACQAPTSDQPPALHAPSGPKNRRQWIRQDRKDLRGFNMVQRRQFSGHALYLCFLDLFAPDCPMPVTCVEGTTSGKSIKVKAVRQLRSNMETARTVITKTREGSADVPNIHQAPTPPKPMAGDGRESAVFGLESPEPTYNKLDTLNPDLAEAFHPGCMFSRASCSTGQSHTCC